MGGIVEYVGFAAAACTTVSFVPQAVKIIRERETAGISLPTYAIFAIGLSLWLVYGILAHSTPIVVANALTLIPALIILGMKIKLG